MTMANIKGKNESAFKKRCVKLMRDKYGAKVIYLHGSAMQEPGLADTLVSTALPFDLSLWVEFKGVATAIRPVQKLRSDDFNKRRPCSYVFVCEEREEGAATLVLYGNSAMIETVKIEGYDVLEAVVELHNRRGVELIKNSVTRTYEHANEIKFAMISELAAGNNSSGII